MINPQFDDSNLDKGNSPLSNPQAIAGHVNGLKQQGNSPKPLEHNRLLRNLLEKLGERDFDVLAYPKLGELREQYQASTDKDEKERLGKQMDKMKANKTQLTVLCIEEVMKEADRRDWGMCKRHGAIFLWNSTHWKEIEKDDFQQFLGEAAEKMGVDKLIAKFHLFRDNLFKQFMAVANLSSPEPPKGTVLVNLNNGTFEVSSKGVRLRPFDRSDFLTYQLPFDRDPKAKAPLFQKYLQRVQPDPTRQAILAEYLGYIFIHPSRLKMEKALLLYGTGANGKSVFFEIVNALLGAENVSSYSLDSLTNDSGYQRAKIGNKLLNYASEINGKLEASIFKQLISGEPVEARLPYGEPFHITDYAKLIFNCNELPKEVEHTNAFFRRFLIVPFDVTIPEQEQDRGLASKIIQQELAGVFNWILAGLDRLLKAERFTHSQSVEDALKDFKKQSDTTKLFLEEMEYKPDPVKAVLLKDLYTEYRSYCIDSGFKPVNKTNFRRRLESTNILIEHKKQGNTVFVHNNRQAPVPY